MRFGAFAATATAASIYTSTGRYRVQVKNLGTNPVYLGDSTVTDANGYPLAANESVELELFGTDLYGVCTTAETADVRFVITSGR